MVLIQFVRSLPLPSWIKLPNREFKIYDGTVPKTSLKMAGSCLLMFFVNISTYLTFESWRNYPEFRGAVSKLGKKIRIRTFSVKLE